MHTNYVYVYLKNMYLNTSSFEKIYLNASFAFLSYFKNTNYINNLKITTIVFSSSLLN